MSLLDDFRRNVGQTVTDVAGKVVERSQQISAQTQLQFALKKLQIEHAKRIHELGKRTYEWYQSGNLVVTGHVPREINELCLEIDDLQRQSDETQRKLDELKALAQAQGGDDTDGVATAATPPATPPAPAALPPAAPSHDTNRLD
jgi:hypothetical protein